MVQQSTPEQEARRKAASAGAAARREAMIASGEMAAPDTSTEKASYTTPTGATVTANVGSPVVQNFQKTVQRDYEAEAETVANIGFTPQTEQDVLDFAYATYGKDLPPDLQAIADKQAALTDRLTSLSGTNDPNNQDALQGIGQDITKGADEALEAQASVATEGGQIGGQLNILQEALKKKSGVGNTSLMGGSEIFAKAGVTGLPALNQSLNAKLKEMDFKYTSFSNLVKEIADFQYGENAAQAASAQLALDKYALLQDSYRFEQGRLDDLAAQETAYEQQLKLAAQNHQYSLEEMNYKFNLDAQATGSLSWEQIFNGGDSAVYTGNDGTLYVQEGYDTSTYVNGQKEILGTQGQAGIEGSQFANNCVNYYRDKFDGALPKGMDSIQGRMSFVDKYGFQYGENQIGIGDAVITSEGDWGHTAAVAGFTEDGKMILEEANYTSGVITSGRILDPQDAVVMGFYKNSQKGGFTSMAGAKDPVAAFGTKDGMNSKEGINAYGAESYSSSPNYNTSDLSKAFANTQLAGADYGESGGDPKAATLDFQSRYFPSKDYAGAKDLILQQATSTFTAGEGAQVRGRQVLMSELAAVSELVDNYLAAPGTSEEEMFAFLKDNQKEIDDALMIAQGGNTQKALGLISGLTEKGAQKAGTTTDPELLEISARLSMALFSYVRAQSGLATTDKEFIRYGDIFPRTTQNKTAFEAQMQAVASSLDTQNSAMLSGVIGAELYDKIYSYETIVSERGYSTEDYATVSSNIDTYIIQPYTR